MNIYIPPDHNDQVRLSAKFRRSQSEPRLGRSEEVKAGLTSGAGGRLSVACGWEGETNSVERVPLFICGPKGEYYSCTTHGEFDFRQYKKQEKLVIRPQVHGVISCTHTRPSTEGAAHYCRHHKTVVRRYVYT